MDSESGASSSSDAASTLSRTSVTDGIVSAADDKQGGASSQAKGSAATAACEERIEAGDELAGSQRSDASGTRPDAAAKPSREESSSSGGGDSFGNAVTTAKDAVLAVAAAASVAGFYLYYAGYIHLRTFYESMGIDFDAIDLTPYEVLAYSSFPIRTRWPQWVFDIAVLALVLYAIRSLRRARNVWPGLCWVKRGADQRYAYAAVFVFASFSAFIVLRAMAVRSATADADSWKDGTSGTPVVFDIVEQKRCNYSPDFLRANGYASAVTATCEQRTNDRAALNLAYKHAGRLLYFGENRTSYFAYEIPKTSYWHSGSWVMYRIAKTDVATPRVIVDPPSTEAQRRSRKFKDTPKSFREHFDSLVDTIRECILQKG